MHLRHLLRQKERKITKHTSSSSGKSNNNNNNNNNNGYVKEKFATNRVWPGTDKAEESICDGFCVVFLPLSFFSR